MTYVRKNDDKPELPANRYLVDLLHNRYTAWIILFISFAITVVAWRISADYAEQRMLERFRFQVDEAQFAIEKRMSEYVQVLRGGLGLFVSSQSVERDEWHEFVKTLELNRYYPGIQGMGFSLWIEPKDKDAVEQRIRTEGFPDFAIKPPGERPQYTSIIYLEPFDTRNQRAFGFDMYSEATRRAAMERARDSGEPAMSGKVKLVQETKTDIQPGFLLYLPFYSQPATTPEERRAHLRGFVYSPFRIRDLMEGILGRGSPEIHFEIYDGDDSNSDNLLYDSDGIDDIGHFHAPATIKTQRTLTMAGRTWTIHYIATPALAAATATSQPLIVAIGGVAIDLLLFYIIVSLSRLRRRADRLAEERMNVLRERELHFKTIADTANDGIITSNERGDISYCNRAACEIFGYPAEALLGTPVTGLFDQARYRVVLRRALELGGKSENATSTTTEIDGHHSSGSPLPLEISVAGWSSGEQRYATTILRDITERKRIDRMKNEFISTVSHELRTPLTSIRGSLGLVASGVVGEIPEQARTLMDTAARNCERLTRLINDILDVEKMESEQMRFDLRHHSSAALLHHAVEHNAGVAASAGITLTIAECHDALIRVDADRFQQVMTNLLANAIKFSPPGGKVTLTCQPHGNLLRTAIQDQGPGVPDEFRSRIFQKFAQADSSDTRQKGGTGLGLAIVKGIVERLGGTVGFDTSPEGTCFYFDLPIADDH